MESVILGSIALGISVLCLGFLGWYFWTEYHPHPRRNAGRHVRRSR